MTSCKQGGCHQIETGHGELHRPGTRSPGSSARCWAAEGQEHGHTQRGPPDAAMTSVTMCGGGGASGRLGSLSSSRVPSARHAGTGGLCLRSLFADHAFARYSV